MKYIVLEAEIGDQVVELPIIFPNQLVHSDVYKALARLPEESLVVTRLVSAGFCNSAGINAGCHGNSGTLNKTARVGIDDHLIKWHDYNHGIT